MNRLSELLVCYPDGTHEILKWGHGKNIPVGAYIYNQGWIKVVEDNAVGSKSAMHCFEHAVPKEFRTLLLLLL